MTVQDIEERPKRRRAETVERLLDAALETFAEIGFAAASVEDICRRGGFTRGAFYSSFRTKDELFAALFERETARNLARAEEQLAGLENEDDPVTAAVERCLSTFRADRTWVLVHTEYACYAARHPEAAAALRRHAEELHRRLTGADRDRGRAHRHPADPPGRTAWPASSWPCTTASSSARCSAGRPARGSAGDRAASDLERTALLLLLRFRHHRLILRRSLFP